MREVKFEKDGKEETCYIRSAEYDYIESTVKELMTTFFKEGCKACYEESEGGGKEDETDAMERKTE